MATHPQQASRGLAPALMALSALLLSACASMQAPPSSAPPPVPAQPEPQASVDARRQAEFDKSQERWHGAKVQELVSKLGQPTSKEKQTNGSPTYVYSKTAKLNGPTGPINFSCVVRYQLDARAERVVGHSIEGC